MPLGARSVSVGPGTVASVALIEFRIEPSLVAFASCIVGRFVPPRCARPSPMIPVLLRGAFVLSFFNMLD